MDSRENKGNMGQAGAKRWIKGALIYEGKAKRLYTTSNQANFLWVEYKDSLTAFNAAKTGSFEKKGELNRNISSLIFRYLKGKGITSHWVEDLEPNSMIVEKLEMVPLEVVVRNVLAGSTAKKFDLSEGTVLEEPLIELFFKDDRLGDPFINDEQALMIKAVRNSSEIAKIKALGFEINKALIPFFQKSGLRLVDFKVEMGRKGDQFVLADEISPDSCRLWEVGTNERLDKDRFRRDLGNVKESYEKIFKNISKTWGAEL